MGLFYVLTILSLLIGLASVLLIKPGQGMHIDPTHLDPSVAANAQKEPPPDSFGEFILHIVPDTFFGAFAEGHVLPVLFLAILCGFGLSKIGKAGQTVLNGINSFSHMLFAVFGYLMRLAPVGAFGAMAFTVGKYGIKSIGSLGLLIGTFYLACGFFVVVVLGVLARMHGLSLYRVLRYFREELLVVLGTSSSEPVLPRLLMKLERLGCKRGVVGLVLPTGYSFNLDGTAIYLTLASLFIAQACDIVLSPWQIFAMIGLMLLTSKGAAGVTGSGFVALVATLAVFPTLPVAGVALIVGIDRFMSEARALTSTMSNIVASIVVSKWENAVDEDTLSGSSPRLPQDRGGPRDGGDILKDDPAGLQTESRPRASRRSSLRRWRGTLTESPVTARFSVPNPGMRAVVVRQRQRRRLGNLSGTGWSNSLRRGRILISGPSTSASERFLCCRVRSTQVSSVKL